MEMTEESQSPAATPNKNQIFKISWKEFHRDTRALAWRLSSLGPWKGIVAVTRGGLAPAAIVAWELDIRLIDTVSIVSYESTEGSAVGTQKKAHILKELEGSGEGLLVIDDLVDTGKTAEILRGMLPKAHFAAVYAKPLGRPLTDTFVTEVSQNTWIVFPWEVDDN